MPFQTNLQKDYRFLKVGKPMFKSQNLPEQEGFCITGLIAKTKNLVSEPSRTRGLLYLFSASLLSHLSLRTLQNKRAFVPAHHRSCRSARLRTLQNKRAFVRIFSYVVMGGGLRTLQNKRAFVPKHSLRLWLDSLRTLQNKRAFVRTYGTGEFQVCLRTLQNKRAFVQKYSLKKLNLGLRTLQNKRAFVRWGLRIESFELSQNPPEQEGFCTKGRTDMATRSVSEPSRTRGLLYP